MFTQIPATTFIRRRIAVIELCAVQGLIRSDLEGVSRSVNRNDKEILAMGEHSRVFRRFGGLIVIGL